MSVYQNKVSIKSWAEAERPREKLASLGKSNLSNAELLAILLGSGSRKASAVDLGRSILDHVEQDLHKLAKLGISELCQFNGMGSAKAISIIAAMELGKRRQFSKVETKKGIRGSQEAALYFQASLAELSYEEFWVLYLNRANKVIEKRRISMGGVSGTVADVKIIFHHALQSLASSIILCHNHPSGNKTPSQTDHLLTKKVFKAGKILEIAVLDHLIIAGDGYYSFADEGVMPSA